MHNNEHIQTMSMISAVLAAITPFIADASGGILSNGIIVVIMRIGIKIKARFNSKTEA